jgi:hypothetical protein
VFILCTASRGAVAHEQTPAYVELSGCGDNARALGRDSECDLRHSFHGLHPTVLSVEMTGNRLPSLAHFPEILVTGLCAGLQ